MQSIPILVISLGFLILIHELGHYLAARRVGIPIQEFGIGFPPKMLTLFRAWGTEFTLNWLPIGGFVRPQERPEDHQIPDEMLAATPGKRIVFLLAGSTMNILLAILLLAASFYILHKDIDHVLISQLVVDSPAHEAGVMVDDQILAINGYESVVVEDFQRIIRENAGQEIELTLLRGEEVVTINLIPRTPDQFDTEKEGALGVGLVDPTDLTILESISESTQSLIFLTLSMLDQTLELIGFKGMNDILNIILSSSRPLVNTLSFVASLSFSLGILNLLPIPIFDGGKILFAVWELVTGKRVPINVYYIANMASLLFVLGLMFFINVRDFVNPVIEATTQTPMP
jgi:regulator of sigma E protease